MNTQPTGAAGGYVVSDPQILGGLPVFAGTRLPIDHVLASLAGGISLDTLQQAYPVLTPAHVEAARHWRQLHPRQDEDRRLADTLAGVPPRSTRTVRPGRG